MQLREFPGCCTAKILIGFGGSRTASVIPDKDYTDETMFTDIAEKLEEAHRGRMALVFSTTTTEQEMANRVLPRIGFIKIDESAKDAHADFALIGWVFRLNLADAVRPLKVPANPFKKGVKVADKALQFGDEDLAEFPAPPEVIIQNGDQGRDEMRRMFNAVAGMPPQVNPAPPRAPRARRAPDRVIVDDDLVPPANVYGGLSEPLTEGQIWGTFIPATDTWLTITTGDGLRDLPLEQHFRVRSGRVGGNHSWYEIHPNDQGRVDMVGVRPIGRLAVRLFGEDQSLGAGGALIQQRDQWQWVQEPRIGDGTITHFCLV